MMQHAKLMESFGAAPCTVTAFHTMPLDDQAALAAWCRQALDQESIGDWPVHTVTLHDDGTATFGVYCKNNDGKRFCANVDVVAGIDATLPVPPPPCWPRWEIS